jgi:hypothetical protein
MTEKPVLAACHIHSEWSYDAKWSLEKLAAEFADRNYRILMMSEHDRGFTEPRFDEYREACDNASSDKMLVVPGIEYSDADNILHVLVWGPVPFLGERRDTNALLQEVRSAGGVAVLAHPSRLDAWIRMGAVSLEGSIYGIELWNRKTDGWAPSQKARLLIDTTGATPFVGLDFHDSDQLFPLSMALSIRTDITQESVLSCLKSRSCRPRAFGSDMDGRFLKMTTPVLKVAEAARKRLARAVKHLKGVRY